MKSVKEEIVEHHEQLPIQHLVVQKVLHKSVLLIGKEAREYT